MSDQGRRYVRFGAVIVMIVVALGYLAYTGVQDSKSYYVTIKELNGMGNGAYSKRLRVAGNVQPGSIKRQGTHLEFLLVEQDRTLPVVYSGSEAPPDTFKDNAQALAEGKFGRDGVFHATNIQAKCASKYAPKQPGQPGAAPAARGQSPRRPTLTGAGSKLCEQLKFLRSLDRIAVCRYKPRFRSGSCSPWLRSPRS